MVGIGYDTHKLAEGESFILGGIRIESSLGTVAHSDGDVLIHAIIDAILGAAGMGDIGDHFPDTDEKYKNVNSVTLLENIKLMVLAKNYSLVNVDATIILETPKLKHYKTMIKKNLANILDLPEDRVNIKATTNEKMGFLGRNEGIAVLATCQLQ